MKREPERSCVGCRTRDSKGALLRVVRRPDGGVGVDPSGRAPGRGAYVHRDRECIGMATRRGALARALRLRDADLATLVKDVQKEIE
jgi:hypothetical protein